MPDDKLAQARNAIVTIGARQSQEARLGHIDQTMTDQERIEEMPPVHRAIVAENLRRLERESSFAPSYEWMGESFK